MSKVASIGALAALGLMVAGGIIAVDSSVSPQPDPVVIIDDTPAVADLWVCGDEVWWGERTKEEKKVCKRIVKEGQPLLDTLSKKCKPCKVSKTAWGQCPYCAAHGDCEAACP